MSLAKRYAFKLFANCATVPVYLTMEAVLPRALGPAVYGEFNFATALFQQCMGVLDMGSSTCLYNALSRRQRETGLIAFYWRVALCVLALSAVAALCALHPATGGRIMPHVPLWMAPLAALWAYLTWLGRVLRSVNDAFGATVSSELMRAALSLGGLLLLLLLFLTGSLGIGTLFAQQYAVLGAMILGFLLITRREYGHIPLRLTAEQARGYRREFFTYSHPLFAQALLSFLFLSGERWLLQWFDGSVEQGFFALAQKVGMACFLFVSAMTPLIMRELSIAWGRRDPALMGRLITRFAPMLYMVAAYFSCFSLVEAEALVGFFGGAAFAQALAPVQIMALYPIHQAYGQLAGSVFHAAGRTALLRNLTALECLYGFAVTWFLLAPASYGGLHLGAAGLAAKTVGVQFVTVNLYLWLASRMVPVNYVGNLIHQMASLAFLLGLAFVCREGTLAAGFGASGDMARFLLSGALYTCLTAASLVCVPRLAGLSRRDLRELWARARGRGRGGPRGD
jgi:O-antigen/teichoic acid export membrane protein